MTTNSRPRQERAADVIHPINRNITDIQPLATSCRETDRLPGRHVGWWIGGVAGTIAAVGICVGSLVFDRASFFWLGLFLLVPYAIMLAAPGWLALVDAAPLPVIPADGPPAPSQVA